MNPIPTCATHENYRNAIFDAGSGSSDPRAHARCANTPRPSNPYPGKPTPTGVSSRSTDVQ